VRLAAEVFELGDARVQVVVRVVDDRRFLIPLDIVRFVLELQRTIGQLAETVIEELIDGPV
jgi:hypothetical protein